MEKCGWNYIWWTAEYTSTIEDNITASDIMVIPDKWICDDCESFDTCAEQVENQVVHILKKDDETLFIYDEYGNLEERLWSEEEIVPIKLINIWEEQEEKNNWITMELDYITLN